jgi:acyl-CoA synthetase (AMP-forming)/AMP-acid ligase II
MRNILQYLEKTAARLPDKTAFVCEEDRITFSELRRKAALYGMRIARDAGFEKRRPVCVIGERDINALTCMLACV